LFHHYKELIEISKLIEEEKARIQEADEQLRKLEEGV
jgi:hypothetical protein